MALWCLTSQLFSGRSRTSSHVSLFKARKFYSISSVFRSLYSTRKDPPTPADFSVPSMGISWPARLQIVHKNKIYSTPSLSQGRVSKKSTALLQSLHPSPNAMVIPLQLFSSSYPRSCPQACCTSISRRSQQSPRPSRRCRKSMAKHPR